MPLFNYRCGGCDHRFEDLVRFDTPDDEVECPRCGEHHAARELSTFAVPKNATACGRPAESCNAASGFG